MERTSEMTDSQTNLWLALQENKQMHRTKTSEVGAPVSDRNEQRTEDEHGALPMQ